MENKGKRTLEEGYGDIPGSSKVLFDVNGI
jgi:hypothetical protein